MPSEGFTCIDNKKRRIKKNAKEIIFNHSNSITTDHTMY